MLSILQVNPQDLPAYAIVCGDPRRAEAIARKLTNARELAFAREYRTFVGEYEGVPLAVVSHGVGSSGAAVCFEELIRGGVKTLIRVGTAGSYSTDHPAGSLIVSTAAVRAEGLTHQLVPAGFPAVADSAVTEALYEAALEGGGVVKKGITVSLDVFFSGVVDVPHRQYKQAGVLAVEMEIAALFVVASLRGARAGAIVALDGYADTDLAAEYDPHTDVVAGAVEREIAAALKTVKKLASA
ncbi:nucleoside phosphorylase [Paenibacillus arenilitoris]|uniref:Uridine phosphorylase n=1 Tax=Paenibacillus arenilitoris TaxID=2772299 RepID=A0A927CS02_9BACL|nr:nucleoside phosphorylase [Paenibacillus arenilitoris]MBD2872679.1 nucleoside phosphorylase [Paenibacillus arenilitoris]